MLTLDGIRAQILQDEMKIKCQENVYIQQKIEFKTILLFTIYLHIPGGNIIYPNVQCKWLEVFNVF
jgi:hypothetical protein